MTKHTVICDRCGKEEKMEERTSHYFYNKYYVKPGKWGEDGKYEDLCPKCFKEYKKHMNKFV